MSGLKASFGAMILAAAGWAAASAQPAPFDQTPHGAAPDAIPDRPYPTNPALRPDQVWAPAGTEVAVQLAQPVGTHGMKTGDTFAIKLSAPVIIDGQVVLAAGTPGVGEVIQSQRPGMGGKAGKLVLSADYLTVPGGAVPLQGFQVAGEGKDQTNNATIASAGGLIFMPLGFLGMAVQGSDVEIAAGTAGSARIAQSVPLYPISAAGPRDYAAVRAVFGDAEPTRSWIDPPPPPPGMGQVVFFRSPSLLGTAQWFNVREHGQALGKLTNGDYFVAVLPPASTSSPPPASRSSRTP